VLDPVDSAIYRTADIPDLDRAIWSVQVGDEEEIQMRIGGGKKAAVGDLPLRVESVSGVNHDFRCGAILEVPAQRFGKEHVKPRDQVSINVSYLSHGGINRTKWQGTFSLSDQTQAGISR